MPLTLLVLPLSALLVLLLAIAIICCKIRQLEVPKEMPASYLQKFDIIIVVLYGVFTIIVMEDQLLHCSQSEKDQSCFTFWPTLGLNLIVFPTILSIHTQFANFSVIVFHFFYLYIRLEGFSIQNIQATLFLIKIIPFGIFMFRFKTSEKTRQQAKVKQKQEGKAAMRVLNLLPEGVAIVDEEGLQYINNSMRTIMKVKDHQCLNALYALENRQISSSDGSETPLVRKSISAMTYDAYRNSTSNYEEDSPIKLSIFSKNAQKDQKNKEKTITRDKTDGLLNLTKVLGNSPRDVFTQENSLKKAQKSFIRREIGNGDSPGKIERKSIKNKSIAVVVSQYTENKQTWNDTEQRENKSRTLGKDICTFSIKICLATSFSMNKKREQSTASTFGIPGFVSLQQRIRKILDKIEEPYRTSTHKTVREAIIDILSKMREEFGPGDGGDTPISMPEAKPERMTKKYISRSLTFSNRKPQKGENIGPNYWAIVMQSTRETSQDCLQHLEIKFTPIIIEGKPALILLVRDVTEKEIIKQAEEKERNQTKALASISHEFRTPLSGIMSMLENLKDHIAYEVTQKYLMPAYNNAKLLLTLVNDILDFHQIKEQKIMLVPVRFHLRSKLEESLSLISIQAKARGIKLSIEIDHNVPEYICNDPNRMQQVVNNLLGNASKFTLEGSITIKVDVASHGKVAIRVIDTGIGIESGDMEKLFKTFGKINSKKNQKLNPQGVGLGLTISNSIAKLLCSDNKLSGLNVDSEPQKGSTFWFVIDNLDNFEDDYVIIEEESFKTVTENMGDLNKRYNQQIGNLHSKGPSPATISSIRDTNTRYTISKNPYLTSLSGIILNDPISKVDNQIEQERDKADGKMRKEVLRRTFIMNENLGRVLGELKEKHKEIPTILMVDDNEMNHVIIRNFLELFDMVVDSAYNGKQAIQKIQERQINRETNQYLIVLLDIQMPIMDGIECAKALTALMTNGELKNIPLIGQSAHEEIEEIQKCKDAGMVDYINKPIAKGKLIETLLKWLPNDSLK